jgi:hypothetical protein
LEIAPPAENLEARLADADRLCRWLDCSDNLSLWSTVREDRTYLVAPGCALYAVHEDRVVATPSGVGVAGMIEDVYWRSVLPLVLQRGGVQVLHASAVVGPRGVVAVCGRSGSGKSTIAYGLSLRGHRLWSDDAVVVSSADPPRSAALAGSLRLLPDVREHFGVSTSAILLPNEVGEQRALSMILVLDRGLDEPGNGSLGRTLTAGEALAAVVEHAYCFDFGQAKRELASDYLALVAEVPVIRVRRPRGLEKLESWLDGVEDLIDSDIS